MLTSSRKTVFLERLAQDGQLAVTPLAIEFAVSEDTVRRDLRELAALGKLVRVHGGAVPISPTHQPLAVRHAMHGAEKAQLARAGADLIRDGAIVILDGGTTHLELANALPLERRCTIVTHSPAVAASFERHKEVEIILVGGRLFRHSMVAMGAETAETFGRLKADMFFLGVTGLHAEIGLTTGDSDEASLKRVMMKAAGETVVLATADKINCASPWGIAPVLALSTLITVNDRPEWLPATVDHIQAG
jgi:DeoR/GlpR family transcriptional regulator of sugar metabolism